jgi:hypothetical protein
MVADRWIWLPVDYGKLFCIGVRKIVYQVVGRLQL